MCPGEGTLCPPCRFFEHCILTDRALKLMLYEFASSFILNIEHVISKFFLINRIICPHRLVWRCPSRTVAYYRNFNSLLYHLSFRNLMQILLYDFCLNTLPVYNTTFFLSLGSSLHISAQ